MKKVMCLLSIMLLLCLWSVAYGQTADGQTPAEESVCDKAGYTGVLWGLCNAYCEAMDCDDKEVNAADAACDKVEANFIAKSGKKGLVCQKFGKPCQYQCKDEYGRDQKTCQIQYEDTLKNCGQDISCRDQAKLVFDNCNSNAYVSYQLCLTDYCYNLNCESHCYDLHLKADDRCYQKFCDSNEVCNIKELDACLDNNIKSMNTCLKRCSVIK